MHSVKKISMILLPQVDIDKAVSFYKELGLALHFQIKGQWAEFTLGDIKIGLYPNSKFQDDRRTGVVFEVDNIKELYTALYNRGVVFLHEPIEKLHGIMASFKDISGNILDLYQPTPEKMKNLMTKVAEEGKEGCCGAKDGCCKAQA